MRAADVVVINKVAGAPEGAVDTILALKADLNPGAGLLTSDLVLNMEPEIDLAGKRVLVVEDGPTVTHGGMSHGAGLVAAREANPAEIIDPAPFAVGSIAGVYRDNPHLGPVLPAMGYAPQQRAELAETIAASGADLVINGSPADVASLLELTIPSVRVRYRWQAREGEDLLARVMALLTN